MGICTYFQCHKDNKDKNICCFDCTNYKNCDDMYLLCNEIFYGCICKYECFWYKPDDNKKYCKYIEDKMIKDKIIERSKYGKM